MILIGGGLLALAGTLNGEVGKTGKTILNWSGSVSSIPAGGGIGDNNPDVHTPDPVNGTAFAVYSETDHSLDFYKRKAVPEVGAVFEGKVVTEVYTKIENVSYERIGYENGHAFGDDDAWRNAIINTPWWAIRNQVDSVEVVDTGISETSLNCWFYRMENVRTIDIRKLDVSKTWKAYMLCCLDSSLEKIELPGFTATLKNAADLMSFCPSLRNVDLSESDLSGVTTLYHAFNRDGKLEKVKLPHSSLKNLSNAEEVFYACTNLTSVENADSIVSDCECKVRGMFSDCANLDLDCSNWDASKMTDHTNFSRNSPGVIEPLWSN